MLRRIFSRMKMLTINLVAHHPPALIVGRNAVNAGRMFPWVQCGGVAELACHVGREGKGSIVSVMYSSGQGLDRCLCTLAASLPLHSSPLFSRPDGFQGGLSALSRLRFSTAQIVSSLLSWHILRLFCYTYSLTLFNRDWQFLSDFDILRVVRVVRPDNKQGHQRTENSSPALINYLAGSVGGGDGVEGDKKFSCYYDNCLPVSQSLSLWLIGKYRSYRTLGRPGQLTIIIFL